MDIIHKLKLCVSTASITKVNCYTVNIPTGESQLAPAPNTKYKVVLLWKKENYHQSQTIQQFLTQTNPPELLVFFTNTSGFTYFPIAYGLHHMTLRSQQVHCQRSPRQGPPSHQVSPEWPKIDQLQLQHQQPFRFNYRETDKNGKSCMHLYKLPIWEVLITGPTVQLITHAFGDFLPCTIVGLIPLFINFLLTPAFQVQTRVMSGFFLWGRLKIYVCQPTINFSFKVLGCELNLEKAPRFQERFGLNFLIFNGNLKYHTNKMIIYHFIYLNLHIVKNLVI